MVKTLFDEFRNGKSISIGFLLFPNLTQLDLTGPYEVFTRVPQSQVHLIWKTMEPVVSDRGLAMLPNATFTTCPKLDIICIPGGPGQIELMEDEETLNFLRMKAKETALVTSVCTGSLVLGAAGLLQGYKATTHWGSLEQLTLLGAEPVAERVVRDGNRITGAGVTSGIDFALNVVTDIYGEEAAKSIQLHMEYDPEPPFSSGSPRSASPELVTATRKQLSSFIEKRRQATQRAAINLQQNPKE
ncbi:DJ-1/PfpI family protein [Rouxiella sp. Mn2063]|uniref:DJ-1/PfpI family protein n=1 Tax=Rouxiella sp. Mn2063 TaxID=3395262 RepID=UPI003BDFF586